MEGCHKKTQTPLPTLPFYTIVQKSAYISKPLDIFFYPLWKCTELGFFSVYNTPNPILNILNAVQICLLYAYISQYDIAII